MLVGVFSDIHDNLEKLRKALKEFSDKGIDTALFLGDFCSPVPAKEMSDSFNGTIHCVFGNGDGDEFLISQFATEESSSLKLHGKHAELEIDGKQTAMTHYPLYGQALARTGDYTAVFSGHTHKFQEEYFDDCLWLNPGDVMGLENQAACAVWNTEDNSAEIVKL